MIYNDIFAAYTHVPILSFANSITVLLILNYLCLNPIVYPLIVHIYGYDIISILTPNFELLLTIYTSVFSVLENVIVLVRCMYVSHNNDNFDAFMRKNVHGFMQRVCNIDNALVKSVTSCVSYILVACGRNGFHFYIHFVYLDLYYMYFSIMSMGYPAIKFWCLMSYVIMKINGWRKTEIF